MSNTILVVDDSNADLMVIQGILQDYKLLLARDGLEAMEKIRAFPEIDIMILDLNMPRMDGFAVLEALQKAPDFQHISVLILTNYDEVENEIRGLEMGAMDYIRKPLNIESLRKRIEVHARLRSASRRLEKNNLLLERKVEERTKELVLTRDITIHALVGLLEVRDVESSNHTMRTQLIMQSLCEQLRQHDRYQDILTDRYIKELFNTAPLHDIGKVGIPDKILLKPAKLTPEEFELIKKHTTFGVEALLHNSSLENSVSFIKTAVDIIGCHHEKFDGSGYPAGLRGEAIPLPGRLMAIVDVYDALVSKRVYKPAYDHAAAMRIIREGRGGHFDPEIVDAFERAEPKILEITRRFSQKD